MSEGGQDRELAAGGDVERPDISAAKDRLDRAALKKLSQVGRCVEALGGIDQEVVAIAPATLPRVNQFDGAGFGESVSSARPRLLALTTESFWVVETRGMMSKRVSGREIKLARLQDDVRINQYRRKSEFGRKTRLLAFDHLVGSELATEAFDLHSDDLLFDFADRFNAQLEELRAENAQDPGQKAAGTSAADELMKLGGLMEKGLLTEEEFLREKQRLLDRA
jgi:hypothetical protein